VAVAPLNVHPRLISFLHDLGKSVLVALLIDRIDKIDMLRLAVRQCGQSPRFTTE
jgi:hypothetical protein